MSIFSEQLSKWIKEKEINVEALYKYCGVDSAVIYDHIRGKGNLPSPEAFQKITEFLHLTPVEYKKFQETYFISKVGKDAYYRRKSVEHFIINFPNPLPGLQVLKPKNPEAFSMDLSMEKRFCTALSSKVEINHSLYGILLEEAWQENGEIALLLQPDYGFLFDLLSSLKPVHSLRIDHLFCVSPEGQMNENNELYSLEYLQTMLPLFVADLDYHPFYFYGDIASRSFNFAGLSCLILTSKYAIACTSDYQMGVLYGNPEVVSMLWDLFASYKEKGTELFQAVKLIPENTKALEGVLQKDKKCYILQPESCLTPFITEEILSHVLRPELPCVELLIQRINEMFANTKEAMERQNTYIYFTQQGLESFADTGKLKEIPDAFYHPFSVENRIKMLRALIPYCKSWHYRIVNKNYPVMAKGGIPENFHLCVNGDFGYLLFTNIYDENVELRIKEQGLLTILEDYVSSIEETCFFSPEEAVELVEDMIRILSQREHDLR